MANARELIFEGKDYRTREWIQGTGVWNGARYSLIFTQNQNAHTVLTDTVRQYINKRDMMGKMIFTGDIVKIHDSYGDSYGYVRYNVANCQYEIVDEFGYNPYFSCAEVVDNIWDNDKLYTKIINQARSRTL